MSPQQLQTQILIVGGETGGTAAALQAARHGATVILVSAGPWLGGMLTSAGVAVPDGNELAAFQTGLWGAYLRELERRQPGGLDHSWVSFFAYEPHIGAQIWADWVAELPNLQWIAGQEPLAVERQGDPSGLGGANRLHSVRFPDYEIHADIILDGTELGDLLALADIPYRWGWEPQEQWQEPSAPTAAALAADPFFCLYPVQTPTWVVLLRDYGDRAPTIPAPEGVDLDQFDGAWANHSPDTFISYGQLPGRQFMINWPIYGNDYGVNLQRLIEGETARTQVWQEAIAHSQAFAHRIQRDLGPNYGLAHHAFPQTANPDSQGGGAFALQAYIRESRRLIGHTTITERDILPIPGGLVAPWPQDCIALGNYPNDHHYPGRARASRDWPLAPKSMHWGGRWTGTAFGIPYGALVCEAVDNLLVCEKNISVSHMANGATRLQPVVLGIGQAAGMAAAIALELGISPRDIPIQKLQQALLTDPWAPAAIAPVYDLPPDHPDWLHTQLQLLDNPSTYPSNGYAQVSPSLSPQPAPSYSGTLIIEHPTCADSDTDSPINSTLDSSLASRPCQLPRLYRLTLNTSHSTPVNTPIDTSVDTPRNPLISPLASGPITLVTLRAEVNSALQQLQNGTPIQISGFYNPSGHWIRVERLFPPECQPLPAVSSIQTQTTP